MGLDLAAFLDEFRAEASEHLQSLDAQLLKLERSPDDPLPIRAMFLGAHTIKGGAAMLELASVRELCHALEDVLAVLRDGQQRPDPSLIDLLFRTLDLLRVLVMEVTPQTAAPDQATEALIQTLRARARGQAPAPVPEVAAPAVQKGRVLLVDDSATVRLHTTLLLNDAGLEVDALADGAEALARAEQTSYDLVITAVETRGLRGPELVAALRTLPTVRMVPIIMFSSDDNPEHQARVDGVHAILRKEPQDRQHLTATVQQLLAEAKR